jgi:hypothetical protein
LTAPWETSSPVGGGAPTDEGVAGVGVVGVGVVGVGVVGVGVEAAEVVAETAGTIAALLVIGPRELWNVLRRRTEPTSRTIRAVVRRSVPRR